VRAWEYSELVNLLILAPSSDSPARMNARVFIRDVGSTTFCAGWFHCHASLLIRLSCGLLAVPCPAYPTNAAVRIQLCARANSNATARTFRNPRTVN